jgi:hypothetical protein
VRTGDTSSALYVTLDNASVGHNFPSGATQDRRAWLEITAYQNGDVIYQSGAVPDDQAVTDVGDPDLWILRDKALDAQGNEAHMFWDVASQVSGTVHVQTTSDPSDPAYYTVSHASRWFPLRPGTFAGIPDRVTARLRMRPLDLDVVDDLIATGHLDSTYRTQIPTFTLLPNKGLAVLPQYASMTSVSMEWSAAAKASPVFSHWPDETQGHPALDCVGMPKQP